MTHILHIGSSATGAQSAIRPITSEIVRSITRPGDMISYLDLDQAPMYNFSIPSTLKAWIDRVAVAGKTFRYTANGPEDLAGYKRVIIASSRGGLYGDNNPSDFQEAYLRQVFSFLGVKRIEIVRAEGIDYGEAQKKSAIESALHSFHEKH